MTNTFLTGFLKQAQSQGFTEQEAYRIAKEAGFWGGVGDAVKGVGNFAWDMVGRPAVGMYNDAARAVMFGAKGQFHNAFNAAGSALGNTALTALNFIPGGGLGSMAVRGGLRGASMLARGVGTGAARASMLGITRGAGQVAAGAARAGAGFAGAQTAARGAIGSATSGMFNRAAGATAQGMGRMGVGMQNMGIPGGAGMQRAAAGLSNRSPNALNEMLHGVSGPGGMGPNTRPPLAGRAMNWAGRQAVMGLPMSGAMSYAQQQSDNPYESSDDYF